MVSPNDVQKDSGKKHDVRRCPCGLFIPARHMIEHTKGKRHTNAIKALQAAAENTAPIRASNSRIQGNHQDFTHCDVCDKDIPTFRWNFHLNHPEHLLAQRHLLTQRLAAMRSALTRAADNKNGVKVSHETAGVDFGVIEPEMVFGSSSVQSKVVKIWQTDKNTRIRLINFRLTQLGQSRAQASSFSATLLGKSRWIDLAGHDLSIAITFKPSYEGRHEETLELTFQDVRRSQQFSITRQIRATVGSVDDQDRLKPKAPYHRRHKSVALPLEGRIISPLRPPTWTETKWTVILLEYKARSSLIKAAYGSDGHKVVTRNFMPSVFNNKTHGRHFQNMLWIEEEQRSRDLLTYAMTAQLVPKYPRYILEVEGLGEGRPSILVGDFILVKEHGTSTDWYKGCVHEITMNTVSLRFSSNFSTYKGNTFDVRFVLNRLPLRRMHQALTLETDSTRILFPEPEHISSTPVGIEQLRAINPINRLIGEDHEQLMTVAAIVHQPPGSVPFVIFGPPGTGKTVTVVEAIRQLLDRDPKVSILACAPSNSAADLIAQRLMVLGPSQLFRLNAASREYKTLPEVLRDFSLVNGNNVFAVPSLERLEGFRVVVTTCVSAGILYGVGVRPGHYSHIFIDEAGQCMEPDAMIPVKTMGDKWTNIVLAGDNKQLGPIIRSQVARDLGLNQSYLARLMAREVYDLQTRTGSTIIKLIKNFRSHPTILEFSNSHFYNGELQPCGDPVLTHSLLRSNLVQNNFPVIFHGIIGKDQQESSSPSFFNIDEVTRVKKYCLELMDDRRLRLKPQDIGIITPYHAQRCKIGSVLTKKLHGIKVGSVEEFQGQERRVIIMSTVRSSTDYLTYDIKHTLGFVANPRRLNVAITRAQAMLIIVGNPMVLSLDPLWRALLNHIHEGGGWRGKAIEWDPKEPILPDGYDQQIRSHAERDALDMISRLKSFIVENTENLATATDSDDEGYMDNGDWREEE